jgi:hypothetical protein
MQFKEVSLAKVIMLGGLIVAILYGLYLGYENVALTAIGVIGGYLVKDLETESDDGEGMNEQETT